MTAHSFKPQTNQDGFTLIEILVTVIILAIGLLGIAALQNTAVKFSYSSYLRSQASILSYDLMDRVRSNPSTAYSMAEGFTPSGDSCIGVTASCTAANMASADLSEWYNNASNVFPDAEFTLTDGNGNGQYQLTISWEDRYENDEDDNATAEDKRSSFTFSFDARGRN